MKVSSGNGFCNVATLGVYEKLFMCVIFGCLTKSGTWFCIFCYRYCRFTRDTRGTGFSVAPAERSPAPSDRSAGLGVRHPAR